MLNLRDEVSTFMRACERLISAPTIEGKAKLTADECQVVAYYARELAQMSAEADAATQSNLQSVLWSPDPGAATRSTEGTSP